MANQTVTKVPDYWRQYRGFITSYWESTNVSGTLVRTSTETDGGHDYVAGYLTNVTIDRYIRPVVVSCSIKVSIKDITTNGGRPNFICEAIGEPDNVKWRLSQSFSPSSTEDTEHTFTFSGITDDIPEIEFQIWADGNETSAYITAPTVTYTYTVPTLGLSVTPSSLYTGSMIYGDISGIFGQTISVQYLYNSTVLESFTTSSESFSRQALDSWFTTAGVSGNSMSVTVSISDSLGRSASARVTVNKPTGGTAQPTAPVSTTENGADTITFAWTYSGDGSQSKAELQYKTSSGTWQSLGAVTTAQTFSKSGWFFPQGTIQWRARIYNTYGYWGAWSNAASFTVSYPTLSVTAAPQSVFVGNNVNLSFANRAGRTLTVVFKNGTSVLYSTNVSADTYTIAPPASWFDTAGITGNSMNVAVTVSDSVNRTANGSFTLNKPNGRTATATAPSGSTVNGTEPIAFGWTSSGDGTQTKSELQWSSDQVTWTALASISGSTSTWTAPAIKFPGGRIYWRVRVYSSFNIWGEWSAAKNFTVQYDAVSQVVPVNSPTSGNYNAAVSRVFSVALQASGPVYEPFRISTATFYWRAGESGDFTALTMTPNGNTASVTVPAGTFPSGHIEWYASATDTTGRTTETDHYVLTALQTEVEAAPLSPVNTVESGNGPIVFRWTYNSLDGSTQSRAQLQYSTDGTTWDAGNIFADVRSAETVYTAPADTFPGGAIYWRVRSYNGGGTAGPWSDAASVTIFAAPVVTGVTGDGKPFATVSWQTTGQMAYEVEVNGKVYGPYFGEDVRSFTLSEPLPDGDYTVRVRAQNQYSLWSEWQFASMTVQNIPGNAIQLDAYSAENAVLTLTPAENIMLPPVITAQPQDVRGTNYSQYRFDVKYSNPNKQSFHVLAEAKGKNESTWTVLGDFDLPNDKTGVYIYADESYGDMRLYDGDQLRFTISNSVGSVTSRVATFTYGEPYGKSKLISGWFPASTGFFLIYRDGELIGKFYGLTYVDRSTLGAHEYYVIQVLPGGYYTKSNTVTATASVDCPMIAPLEDRDAAFIPLPYVENYSDGVTINRSVNTVKTQFSGAKYPTIEIGEGQTYSASLGTFWLESDSADADKLEALLKKPVILKTPQGRVLVGVLDRLPSLDLYYKRAYTISLEQMEWSDFVDDVPRN